MFLRLPDLVEATNNIAERALRFNITARKLSGCNRTDKGARAQEILPTIGQTCKKDGKNPIEFFGSTYPQDETHHPLRHYPTDTQAVLGTVNRYEKY